MRLTNAATLIFLALAPFSASGQCLVVTREIQKISLVLVSSSTRTLTAGDTFTASFQDSQTGAISATASAIDLQQALESSFPSIGAVSVSKQAWGGGEEGEDVTSTSWTVTFLSEDAGNVPQILVTTANSETTALVQTLQEGGSDTESKSISKTDPIQANADIRSGVELYKQCGDEFNPFGPISGWDTSGVTDMSYLFFEAATFDGDVSGWDTSSVIHFNGMFMKATAFNGDVSGWDTSSAIYMNSMFEDASVFNGDVSGWDTSSATEMGGMFYYATAFNRDVSSWDTSSAINMDLIFTGADAFTFLDKLYETKNCIADSDCWPGNSCVGAPLPAQSQRMRGRRLFGKIEEPSHEHNCMFPDGTPQTFVHGLSI